MRPTSHRLARAIAPAAVALALAAGATRPATATDVAALRARAQRVADDVSALVGRLDELRSERARLTRAIDDASRTIGALEIRVEDADDALRAARADYVERAVDAYKDGATGAADLFLSARDLTDLVVLAKAGERSAELAEESLDRLVAARAEAERAQDAIAARKARLIEARARVEELSRTMAATLARRQQVARELRDRIAELEAEARRAARAEAEAQARARAEAGGNAGAPGPSVPPAPDAPYGAPGEPSGFPTRGIPEGFVGTGVRLSGIASWYGPGFEGNLTANGDVFDPDKFTAASLDLPLGSWLYVERAGRGVLVYVNDRGPYIPGRILDLSRAAAFSIGITGLGYVEAEVVVPR
ncbi:MAG TPA: septal ring lytic transglycosylase RlpA family protein [Actinomycetota bacterium]|nr:septal ring lytic transglycosylase RlpA family protein [Actinomycetota bacterium]